MDENGYIDMVTESEDFDKFRELITVFCRGDADAVRLCEDFLQVAHIWDDLYDKDKELPVQYINKAFCNALGNIPRNPYYQSHIQEYSVLSLLAALTWQIANKFENGNEDELIGSFILRNTLILIVYFTILLSGVKINDDTWGIDIGESFFREFYQGFHNKYEFFLSEMRQKNESLHKVSNRSKKRQKAA